VLFYAEGIWDAHLEAFAELPAGSIIFHIDRSDLCKVKRILGPKFCLSGGIPNALLHFGTPDQVRAKCKAVIDELAQNGGYIMDASAIMQNDTTVENMRALTGFTREYGVYPSTRPPDNAALPPPAPQIPAGQVKPGVCIPWDRKLKALPPILGDTKLCERIWEEVDGFAYLYIWHLMLGA
jgi:hypothetical protein